MNMVSLSPTSGSSAPFAPDLLQNLLTKAAERRSLHYLAMAFRLKYPRWGSQSVLITLGLAGFLDIVKWDFAHAEYRIMDYLDLTDDRQSAYLRSLRLTQIRHLVELNSGEEVFTLRPADDSEKSRQLTWMANQGYLLYELQDSLQQELDSDDYSKLAPLLNGLTVQQYVEAVHEDDRASHPHSLDERVMFFKKRILNVANEYATHSIGTATSGPRMQA